MNKGGSSSLFDLPTTIPGLVVQILALGVAVWILLRLPGIKHTLRWLPWTRWLYRKQFLVKTVDDRAVAEETGVGAGTAGNSGTSDTNIGAGVSALIRQETQQLPGDPRLDYPQALALLPSPARDPLSSSDLGVVTEGPGGAVLQGLARLARRIPDREILTLEGTLLPAGDKGPGLALSLSGKHRQIEASVTLWEDTYKVWDEQSGGRPNLDGGASRAKLTISGGEQGRGPPNRRGTETRKDIHRYYLLASVGAAWTQHHLVDLLTRRPDRSLWRRRPNRGVGTADNGRSKAPRTPGWRFRGREEKVEKARASREGQRQQVDQILFTWDWQSYALLKAGLYWQEREQLRKARVLYVQALGRDPDNLLATFQLGVLDILLRNHQAAVGRLGRVPTRVDYELDLEDGETEASRELLRASYPAPRVAEPREGEAQALDEPRPEPARSTPLWYQAVYNGARAKFYLYKELCKKLEAEGDEKNQVLEKEKDHALDLAEKDARRLLAAHHHALSILIERRKKLCELGKELNEDHDKLRVFLSHLEGVWLIFLANVTLESPERGLLPRRGSTLTREELFKKLNRLSPLEIVEDYVVQGEVTDRAHYNLACFYSRLSESHEGENEKEEDFRRALEHLKSGLSPVPALWPWTDLDLEPLRTAKPADLCRVIDNFARPDVRDHPESRKLREEAREQRKREGTQPPDRG